MVSLNLIILVLLFVFLHPVTPEGGGGKKRFGECNSKAIIMLLLYLINRSVMAIMETIGASAYMQIQNLDPEDPDSMKATGNFFLVPLSFLSLSLSLFLFLFHVYRGWL